jgi:secreted trypsin-like serine protease
VTYYLPSGFGSIWDDIASGIEDSVPKVVGGSPDPDPSVVQLSAAQLNAIGAFVNQTYPTCTGTLIAPRIVLSAAHCTAVVPGTRFVVGRDARSPTASAEVVTVVRHPQYRVGASGSDYLLAYLDRDLPAEPLRIGGPPSVGEVVETVGYGRTEAATEGNTARWWLSEPVRDVGPDTFAVMGVGQHGMCLGDSGGPALQMENGNPVVVGTLSWGERDCTGTDVFQHAGVVTDWIRGTIEGWQKSPPHKPRTAMLGWGLGVLLVGVAVGVVVRGVR